MAIITTIEIAAAPEVVRAAVGTQNLDAFFAAVFPLYNTGMSRN